MIPARGVSRYTRILHPAFAVATALALALPSAAATAAQRPSDLVGGQASGTWRMSKLPDLEAPSGVLMTMDGRELWARAPDSARPMASITKVMTVILALERLRGKFDERVTISKTALGVEESDVRLVQGQRLTVRQLLEAAMVHSSNGAAIALAEKAAGGETEFVRLMNRKAESLDLRDTVYVNAHGLDEPGHHSTARDIAVLARYAMRDPEFRRLARMRQVTLPKPDGGTQELDATNKLLSTYRGAEGVKTGWTNDAGYSVVAAAKRQGVELVAVVLGTPSERARFAQAAELLDWGFAHYRTREVGSVETTVGTVPVADYLDVAVPVRIGGTRKVAVFDFEGSMKRRIDLDESVRAPVQAGQRIGTVTVYQRDRMLAQLPAVAAWDIQRPGWFDQVRISFVRVWRGVFGGPRMAVGSTVAEGE